MFPETLETERLRLERFSRENFDALELHRHYAPRHSETIEEEFEHVTQKPHATPKETWDRLVEAEEKWDEAEWATYAVISKPEEEFAGTTNLALEWEKRTGLTGLWLRKPFWGRDYSGERAMALLALAFDRLDLEVVSPGYLDGNEQSKRAIEKYVERFGGQYDGVLRNWVPFEDEVRDLHRYTILREQWEEHRPDDDAVTFRE